MVQPKSQGWVIPSTIACRTLVAVPLAGQTALMLPGLAFGWPRDGDGELGEGRRVGECSTTDFRPIDRAIRRADDPGMVVKRSVQSVAVYARRSRKKETLGIDVQLSRCRAVAAEEGWRIADEYVDDDRSAYGSAVRESYDQMMADLAAGRFDAVLVYKADRLGRDDRERRRFEDAYTSAGLWLVATSSGGRYDLRTADGVKEFREAIIGAEHYSRQLSERMRDHHRMLAETGQDSGGMRPFGFEPDRVTVRASEAAVIRDAAQRVLRGESLRSIAGCSRPHGTAASGLWTTGRSPRSGPRSSTGRRSRRLVRYCTTRIAEPSSQPPGSMS